MSGKPKVTVLTSVYDEKTNTYWALEPGETIEDLRPTIDAYADSLGIKKDDDKTEKISSLRGASKVELEEKDD